jgi:hypothetical protein
MKKVLSVLALVFCIGIFTLNARSVKIEQQAVASPIEIDDCAVLATSLALEYSSPELSYYRVWFTVYGSCINGDGWLN